MMKTITGHITYISDEKLVQNKVKTYTYAFHSLYKQFELSTDKNFIEMFKQQFQLNEMEYRSLVIDTKSFINREYTQCQQLIYDIEYLQYQLNNIQLNKHKRYKLQQKLSYKQYKLNHNKKAVFGGKKLLQQITREHNRKNKDLNKISKLTEQYRNNRNRSYYMVGEANQKGGRFFDFSNIVNGVLIFKPYKGVKCEIKFKYGKSVANDFKKIQELTNNNILPITVMLNKTSVNFSFNEEILQGFGLDTISRNKEVKEIKSKKYLPETEKQLIKNTYKKYYKLQEQHKLEGKIINRGIAIDSNPEKIGCSIIEKVNDTEYKILKTWTYDLSYFFKKRGYKSNDKRQKKLNNKRKIELSNIIKQIFNIAIHYKCAYFSIEDLNIKSNVTDNYTRESNRKIKNLWCRDLIKQQVTKRCNETGIQLIEINPAYTSFIGNIQHPFEDACSASIEINRRGLFKYIKNTFYPSVKQEDINTLVSIYGRDVLCSTNSWVTLYKSLSETFGNKEFQYRFRTLNIKCKCLMNSMNSYKSRIISYNYKYL